MTDTINDPNNRDDGSRSHAQSGSVVGGEFYAGIEWMAAWMLDNVEGEQVDELTLRQWAVNAWLLHLEKRNA